MIGKENHHEEKYTHKNLCILVILALPPIVTLAYSKGDDNSRPQDPPPEAIKACENKNAGDTTSFTGPQGETLTGICKEIQGQLAAVPEGGRR